MAVSKGGSLTTDCTAVSVHIVHPISTVYNPLHPLALSNPPAPLVHLPIPAPVHNFSPTATLSPLSSTSTDRRRPSRTPVVHPQNPLHSVLLPRDHEVVALLLSQANALLPLFQSAITLSATQLTELLEEAFRAADENYSIRAAQEWGAGFKFNSDALDKDLADFKSCGSDLTAFCVNRQRSLSTSRLSPQRVYDSFGPLGDKVPGVAPLDFRNLVSFATQGVALLVPEGFQPCVHPPPLRQKYVAVANAVNKGFAKQHQKGQLLILPLAIALHIPGIHFSSQHWTEKKGKPQGRPIGDLSNADEQGTTPLNGTDGDGKNVLRGRIEDEWSAIHHPTLSELMLMILRTSDQHGMENITLWKKDLQGAFNLLWFLPSHVRYMAFLLTGNLVVLHLVGMFGWAGMPHAFAVVTRCVIALVRYVIQGEADMYVDDICGVSPTLFLEIDMANADTVVTHLLGPEAIATDKNEAGRRLEWIGWDIDLDKQLVTLSKRNLLKTIYMFFSFTMDAKLKKSHVEAMASLASRCSMLTKQMRPYTLALHDCAAQYTNPNAERALPAPAQRDVVFWRVIFVAINFDEARLARRIDSFRKRPPTYMFEYDSSLSAFSVGVSSFDAVTGSKALLAEATILSPFAATVDSGKQNTYEYLAVLLGLLLSRHIGLRDFSYQLLGDSVSSLAWAANDRAASALARRANIGITVVAVDIQAQVAGTEHIPGLVNVVWDGRSRGKSMAEVGLDPTKEFIFTRDHPIHQFMALCDPDLPLVSYSDHIAFTSQLQSLLAAPEFFRSAQVLSSSTTHLRV